MKKILALLLTCLLLLAGCAAAKEPSGALSDLELPTAAPTLAPTPTTVAPTEAPTEPPTTVPPTEPYPQPGDLVGTWTRAYSEVEGYKVEYNPGVCTLVIEGTEDALVISYTDTQFPDSNYAGKALIVKEGELHYNCGNDRWLAEVDYVGLHNTTYSLTLTEDGQLILQNYFLLDGAPSVSYEFFVPMS